MKLQASAANSFVESNSPKASGGQGTAKEKDSRAGKNQWNRHLYSSSSEYDDEYDSEQDTKSSGAAAADHHNKLNTSAALSHRRYDN